MKAKLLLLFLGLFFSLPIQNCFAQEFTNVKKSPTGVVRCATVENEVLLKSEYPDRETTQQFENWISQKIEFTIPTTP